MLIGTRRIYESLDRGDSLANLSTSAGPFVGNGATGHPIAYGGRLNGVPRPDVFYVGAGNTIMHRVVPGRAITTPSAYPGSNAVLLPTTRRTYPQFHVLGH